MGDLPDITRLRAALDVALTTLDSCSRPNSAAPSPAPAVRAAPSPAPVAPRQQRSEAELPKAVPSEPQNKPLSLPADESTSQEEPVQNSVIRDEPAKPQVVVDQNLLDKSARQETRIKELEGHILRKSKEELDLAKKAIELEHQLEDSAVQIQEYENKLAQVLPLLQTLDQSRQEARESKRRAQITADELVALTGDHQLLAHELAKSRKECAAAIEGEEAASLTLAEIQAAANPMTQQVKDLEKQLQDDKDESSWLQEVAARQATEMEETIQSLKDALETQNSKYEDLENQQQDLCAANDQLVARMKHQVAEHGEQQEQVCERHAVDAAAICVQVGNVISRMSAGNAGLAEEMVQLQTQLAALQAQQVNQV